MAPPKNDNNTDQQHVIMSNLFLQRMHDPSITRGLEVRLSTTSNDGNSADLLSVPWKLQFSDSDQQTRDEDGSTCTKQEATSSCHQEDEPSCTETSPLVYPPVDYLELRRIQNKEWATDRLREGIRLAKEHKSAQAEECYKQGLDLVPTHAELFVAYGALCHNLGRTQEAIDKLQHALELDPSVPNAQSYLDTILNKSTPSSVRKQAGSVMRSETAMQDALTERLFLENGHGSIKKPGDNEYQLVNEERKEYGTEEDLWSVQRRHKKEKKAQRRSSSRHDDRDRSRHRKSQSRRKRHKHYDFSSDEDSNESRSRHKRRKHGRRHHRRDSYTPEQERNMNKQEQLPSSANGHGLHYHRHRHSSDETSEESKRRRRRKRKKRRKHRESSDNVANDDSYHDRKRRKARRKERRKQSHKHNGRSRDVERSTSCKNSEAGSRRNERE